jgi:hypothetical protein
VKDCARTMVLKGNILYIAVNENSRTSSTFAVNCLKVSQLQMWHTVHLFLRLMVPTLLLLSMQQLPASELFYGLTLSLVLNFSLLISPSLLWIIPPSQKLCQQKLALEIPSMTIPHLSYQNSKLSYEYFATVVPQDPWCLFVMLFQVLKIRLGSK